MYVVAGQRDVVAIYVGQAGALVEVDVEQKGVAGVFGDLVIAGRQLHVNLSIHNVVVLSIYFHLGRAVRADENHCQAHRTVGAETQYRARFHFQRVAVSDAVYRDAAFAVGEIGVAQGVEAVGCLVVAEMTFVALLRAAIRGAAARAIVFGTAVAARA